MRFLLLVVLLLSCLAGCSTPVSGPRASYVSPYNYAMPVIVHPDGSFNASPDPEWYPYFGSVTSHVNDGGVPDLVQMRAVKCNDNLVVIELDIGESTACKREGIQE